VARSFYRGDVPGAKLRRRPVGSITEQDVLPTSSGNEVQLPYPMQIGFGTWDLVPGLTYLGQTAHWPWGGQTKATLRLGHNNRDWKLGNRGMLALWGARRFARHLSISARARASTWGDIDRMDEAASVNPAVVPTARTDLRGGTRLDAGLGANLYTRKWKAFRVSAEWMMPVCQKLHGPQLEADWTLTIGVQITPRQPLRPARHRTFRAGPR